MTAGSSVHRAHRSTLTTDELTRELRRWFTTSRRRSDPGRGTLVRASERTPAATWELASSLVWPRRTRFLRLSTTGGRSGALRRSRSGSMIGRGRLGSLRLCAVAVPAGHSNHPPRWVGPMAEPAWARASRDRERGLAGLAELGHRQAAMLPAIPSSPPAQERLAIEIAVRQVELALADYKARYDRGEPVQSFA